MKKIITILAIATTLSLANASVDVNLKYSMKGTEVSELQDFLVDKGFLASTPSGFFGLLTLKAVKSYQLSIGLPSSGFVGQMTRAKINESLALEVASSTEAEIKEVGASTPVVTPVIVPPATQVIYYVPVAPTPAPVVVPVEDVYTLNLINLKEEEDVNRYCNCTMVVGFRITPVATQNNKPIEVVSCTLPLLQLTENYRKEYNDVAFHASSGEFPRRLREGEKGIVSCTLVNGKVLSN